MSYTVPAEKKETNLKGNELWKKHQQGNHLIMGKKISEKRTELWKKKNQQEKN